MPIFDPTGYLVDSLHGFGGIRILLVGQCILANNTPGNLFAKPAHNEVCATWGNDFIHDVTETSIRYN